MELETLDLIGEETSTIGTFGLEELNSKLIKRTSANLIANLELKASLSGKLFFKAYPKNLPTKILIC